MIGSPVHLQERRVFNVSEERNRQARKQLWLPSTFVIVEASPVLNYFSGLGVVQIPLPPGEFLVGMQDPAGARRFGMVRFEGSTTWRDGRNRHNKGRFGALSHFVQS
ncbi:hypothetical protein CSB88_6285 [Pseudomonas aeruginosa]|uniref:hypothetical protein n=1 Tax=Pseudomonas aeruginosa TaxID=287 RepID=UPI000D4F8C1D|nr:hypothetical protein [Pseudomonas aeruginosa]PRW00430.1 hypothetical protein CSB88_6285 [Pseudomonas aeruginosa]